jgi:hypothetical protein
MRYFRDVHSSRVYTLVESDARLHDGALDSNIDSEGNKQLCLGELDEDRDM